MPKFLITLQLAIEANCLEDAELQADALEATLGAITYPVCLEPAWTEISGETWPD